MKKISLLFFIISAHLIFSQPLRRDNSFIPGTGEGIFLSSIQVIPSDSLNKVYYTYRIPYNRLVFEKTGDKYSAEYSIGVEVFDDKDNFVVRTFSGKKIDADNFEQTNISDVYIEGMNEFEIQNGKFNVIPFYNDIKSGREIKLKPFDIVTSLYRDSKILQPIVVDAEKIICSDGSFSAITNYEGNFPFTEDSYNLIIPVSYTETDTLFVSIINSGDTVYNGNITESFTSGIKYGLCNDRIILMEDPSGSKTRNFILSNFSNKLNAGNLMIQVSESKNFKEGKTFQNSVVWYNKPMSLSDPEFAIRALKFIGDETVVKELLKEKDEKYEQVLFEYWKKYDPTPNTAFNRLMSEYYHRIDFAANSFKPIAGKSGIETDRGKVLIKYGKPQRIERTSNEYGKVVETWVYENPQRTFIFVDQRGTGDFSLTKG